MRRTGLTLLLIWLGFLTQACISEVKPILKQTNTDIPARIANQQKHIDRFSSAGASPPDIIKEAQEKLNLVKTRYSRLQTAGGLTDAEIRKLAKMLDESGDLLYKPRGTPRAIKTGAPPQPGKGRKKKVAAPDQTDTLDTEGEPKEQE